MIHTMLVLAASLSATATPQDPVEADAEAKAVSTQPLVATPMEQFDSIESEYDKTMQAFWKEFQEQPEEEQGAFYEQRPSAEAYVPRFLELAAAHPETEAAASSYVWVAQSSEENETVMLALDALIVDHVDSKRMVGVCSILMRKYDVGEQYLKDILEQSASSEVQGSACFNLGRHYMSCADLVGTLAGANEAQRQGYVDSLGGQDVLERLVGLDPAELQHEAEECFERVCVEYPDISYRQQTLGQAAENNLYQIRNLQIGMLAPEIEGEDIFGTQFKLSDYRDKVVAIDFWGDW